MGLFRKKKPDAAKEPPAAAPAAGESVGQRKEPPAGPPAVPAAGQRAAPAAAPAASAPATAAASGPTTVTVMDAFGRQVQLPRAQWRGEVLPRLVEACARDPHRLAGLVLQGLRDGLASDVLPAALRLTVVDPDPERSLSILAAVQRDAGDVDACAATLQELLQKRPQSPAARVGMALLRDRQGNRVEATALLWEALQLDANHADALHGWLQWEQQRLGARQPGDEGRDEKGLAAPELAASVDAACALPGAWRARLWRVRRLFGQGQVDDAVAEVRAVFALAGDESDALLMAATDLLAAGRQDLMAELVQPRYRLERHHPGIGICLLQHFVATRQPEPGERLLHELRLRFPRVLDGQLARFDAEFAQLVAPPATPAAAAAKVTLYRLDRPLWFGPLGDPEWLLPQKPAGSRRVIFASLAVQAPAAAPALQREDELGRLSRALPLFLAEQCWFASPLRGSVALPVADGGGWVVSAVPWAEERLVQLLTDSERQETLLVSGVLRPDGRRRRVDLWVYDCAARQRLGHAAAEGEEGRLGPVLLQLLAELSPSLGGAMPKPPLGSEAFWDRHATGLAQLAALVVAQLGAMPRHRVYGQRAIFEWLLAVALEEPRWTPAKLAFAAAICADAAIGSVVHRELAAPFAELFRVEPAPSAFARAAVAPLRLLGLDGLWQHRRAEIVGAADEAYRSWLPKAERPAG